MYVLSDVNGRVGMKQDQCEYSSGNFDDTSTKRNSYREELINLCLENGLVITNKIISTQAKPYTNMVQVEQFMQVVPDRHTCET